MNGEERLKMVIRELRERPALTNGPVEAVILGELRQIRNQVATLEQMILARLYLTIEGHFNEPELQNICFQLGVDYENLAGQGKSARAQSLVSQLHRNGRIGDLIQLCRQLRPGASF
jgi:hypothetical protein